ncbi:MAG TPA: hypothetical protein EYQ31_15590, partial [Candidatus Handelsmanbacteria bacterium]|nr:hypothetical protein [Candidatus Handelsmanbacteria bacterium]
MLVAMHDARERDMIARQYSDHYKDLLGYCLPWLIEELATQRPTAESIVRLHLRIMAEYPDSLIARKCGMEIASQSAVLARQVLGSEEETEFHQKLSDL